MAAVKRMCVLYPDGSLNLMSGNNSEAAQVNEARKMCSGFNRGETNPDELAMFGEIEVNLSSFKERH